MHRGGGGGGGGGGMTLKCPCGPVPSVWYFHESRGVRYEGF